MGISTAESQFLFKEKLLEGKCEVIANQEIIRDKEQCKKTKQTISLGKKIIKQAIEDKEKKQNMFKKAFQRLTEEKKSEKIKKHFDSRLVLYKRRVMNALKEKPQCRCDLKKSCCMELNKVNEIIFLLDQEGLIKSEQVTARETVYSLK